MPSPTTTIGGNLGLKHLSLLNGTQIEISAAPWCRLHLRPAIFGTRPPQRSGANRADRAVKEPLSSAARFSFHLFPFGLGAACSHLHAVAGGADTGNCSPRKPELSNGPRLRIPNAYCMSCGREGRREGGKEAGPVAPVGAGPGGADCIPRISES